MKFKMDHPDYSYPMENGGFTSWLAEDCCQKNWEPFTFPYKKNQTKNNKQKNKQKKKKWYIRQTFFLFLLLFTFTFPDLLSTNYSDKWEKNIFN